jgi:hypothetical protein
MKCVVTCVLVFWFVYFLVKTTNLKKILNINNIEDLENMLKYETHLGLRRRYFPGRTERSEWRETVVTVSRPSFEAGAFPKQVRNFTTCASRNRTNHMVKQDWSRRRTWMEAFSVHRVARYMVTQHLSSHWNTLKSSKHVALCIYHMF